MTLPTLLIALSICLYPLGALFSAQHVKPYSERCLFHKEASNYLLPPTHPLKPLLDNIFQDPTVLHDMESLTKAGFLVINSRKRVPMRIIKHPLVPGYLFKVFLEEETTPNTVDKQNKNFLFRCQAAETIRSILSSNRITNFVVPDKWLYLPPTNEMTDKRRFVLVVTEMHILNEEESRMAWMTKITPQHLQEYLLIKERVPLSQTIPANIPYTQEGQFAFIDTEKRSFKVTKLENFLSPEMQVCWRELLLSSPNNW